MKNLKQIKEVSHIDQFMAIMDMLAALGYDTSQLSILDVAQLKYDILNVINASETVNLETRNQTGYGYSKIF